MCMCSKLAEGRFDEIDEDEARNSALSELCELIIWKARVLQQAYKEAPQLFNTAVPIDLLNNRKRRRSDVINRQVKSLVESYSDPVVKELLNAHGAQWQSKPLSILHVREQGNLRQRHGHQSSFVRIYTALNQIDQKDAANNILKRILCIGFSQLHEKGRKVEDITAQILAAKVIRCSDPNVVTQKVYGILRIGRKWQKIIDACSTTSSRDSSGIVYILGKHYMWVTPKS